MNRRWSLTVKILALSIGSLTALAGVMYVAVTILGQNQVNITVRENVQSAGSFLGSFIGDRKTSLLKECNLVADLPILKSVVQEGDAATVKDSLGDYRKKLEVDELLVHDRDGKLLASTNGNADSAHLKVAVSRALDGGSSSGMTELDGKAYVFATTPIVVGGYTKGVLTAGVRIDDRLARKVSSAVGTNVVFFLGGKTIGKSVDIGPFSEPPSKPSVLRLKGKEYVAMVAMIPGGSESPVRFVVLQDYAPLVAPFEATKNWLAIVFAVSLVVALVLGFGLTLRITRPLEEVVQAARRLQAGEWPEPFGTTGTDEVGLLKSVFNDMTTSLRQSRERLLAMFHLDPLTELSNHRAFKEKLETECLKSSEEGCGPVLILFDIDKFGDYNTKQGHRQGDRLLTLIGTLLQSRMPKNSILGRYGGGVFGAVLSEGHDGDVTELISGVTSAIRDECGVTVSVGYAELGVEAIVSETLLLAAELSVAEAKQLGPGRLFRFANRIDQQGAGALHDYLNNGSYATVRALAEAVDAKDHYTRGHSLRVASYATELARELGHDEQFCNLVFMTGTLHDVGKIGVPDAVLQKPSRLDDDERLLMESHPVLGEKIVSQVPQLTDTLPGVRHHHERWDGKGYPDGLRSDGIPVIARILAVADTFDAMTSDRPYRKGLAEEAAVEEIDRGAGTQFDPEIAKVFVAAWREKQSQAA